MSFWSGQRPCRSLNSVRRLLGSGHPQEIHPDRQGGFLLVGSTKASAHCPGAQRAEVRAGVGFGDYGGGQDLARGDAGQPLGLLRRGPAELDELGRDLGAGAQRTDADIAARQLFRDEAHGELAEAEAAVRLGDRQAEDPHLAHLPHHLQRDERVVQVPLMRIGRHPRRSEPPHLVLQGQQHLILEPGRAERPRPGLRPLPQQCRDPRPHPRRRTGRHQRLHRGTVQPGHVSRRQIQIGRPDKLRLADRQPPPDLRQILPIRRQKQRLFQPPRRPQSPANHPRICSSA